MLRKILSITGKPGLFKIISSGNRMLVVEDLVSKKRMPAHTRDKIVALGDIAMYTEGEDKPLGEILDLVYANRKGEKINVKELQKNGGLRDLFAEILPDFDRDRVYDSDIRKLFSWYNILVDAGMTEFTAKQDALVNTDFDFKGQKSVYHGKVRDVYDIDDKYLVMVATDRISAFDVILPEGIPYKGQVLNQIAARFLDATADIVPNWKISVPDPMVTVGKKCNPLKIEMIVRGYLAGSAWREYAAGAREICGVKLPEGLRENQRLPEPILTPTTKADEGHDMNISHDEIIAQGIVEADVLKKVEDYALKLFARGTEMAAKRGLILVDTKYEFGLLDGEVILIDEIHTPDSSRYFYAEGYEERFEKGEAQRQLSKEFVRQWLIDNGFMGKPGQKVPEMTPEVCKSISDRYIELYENITGEKFQPAPQQNVEERIRTNVEKALEELA